MILEHSNAAPYNVQQAQGVAALVLLETDLVHWTIIFVSVTHHLGGHQLYSKKNSESLISAMTTENTFHRWEKCIRLCQKIVTPQ